MNVECSSNGPSKPPGLAHGPPQILLVEDDEFHRHLMGRAFSKHADPMDVSFAGNLKEARAYLSQATPDLLIVDLVLPDGRGLELLPEDEQASSYPVVFFTGHGDEQVAVEVMKSGALDYIVKSESTLSDIPQIALSSMREWDQLQQRRRARATLAKSEAWLHSAVDDAPCPMMTYDEHGRFVHVNKMWTQLSGYASDHLEHIKDWTEHAVTERHTDVTRMLMDVHRTGQHVEAQKLVVEASDGRQRIWLLSAAPLGKTPNGPRLALAMATDATESAQLADRVAVNPPP